MRINKEYINDKKIILYGDGKEMRDFLYIFDWIKYSYLITPNNKTDASNNIYSLKELKNEDKNKILVIICWSNHKQAIEDMKKYNLEHNKNYIVADDIFYLLDNVDEEHINTKKLYIWGTGETQKNLENWFVENEFDFYIEGYVDNNPAVWGKKINNKEVISPENLFEKENTYTIVASIYFDEIRNQFEANGKIYKKDFECFTFFESRPSKMMKMTMYDRPIKVASCRVPFDRITYTCYGNYPCCVSWVKYPIGSLVTESPYESWDSIVMKLYRLSLENRTYSFCKKGVCKLLPENPELLSESDFPKSYSTKSEKDPKLCVLGLDDSCNLHCESCREKTRVTKGALLEKRKKMAEKLIDSGMLENANEMFLSVDGEVFANEVDKTIIFSGTKRKNIHILTNANLLTEDKLELLKEKYDSIDISISIDAASEETYSKLRRGGNWNKLQTNLEVLSKWRSDNKINFVDIRMVVQEKNYFEMRDFVRMAIELNFDKVIFSRINNYGTYSDEEYKKISLIDKENMCLDSKLEKEFRDDIFNKGIVDISEFKQYIDRSKI